MLHGEQGIENAGIVAFFHDPGELVEKIQRTMPGKITRLQNSQGAEISGDAFADVGQIFETINCRCRMDSHGAVRNWTSSTPFPAAIAGRR